MKNEFKVFVRNHPQLVKFVKNGSMTWQKFYELYSLYGENNNVWDEYLKNDNIGVNGNNSSNRGISDVFNMIKNIDPNVLQQNINSIQKFLGFVQDFVGDNKIQTPQRRYTPRPTGKMFED